MNKTPIALVVNMDKVKIDLDTPEKYLPVSLEQEAHIGVMHIQKKNFLPGDQDRPVIDLNPFSAD